MFHLYGFILGIAIVVGWAIAEKISRQLHVPQQVFEKAGTWAVIGGVIGARLYHVVDYWWYYQSHLNEIVYLWKGGLGIWGAVIGGLVGLLISVDRRFWLSIIDSVAVVMPLSQAIGRWGNFVNQELYGKPTEVPWKLFIPEGKRLPGFESVAYYHPLFLYESLLNTLLFSCLWFLSQKHSGMGKGVAFGGYLIGYGVIRFILEPLRINSWAMAGFPVAQLVSVIMIGVGFYWINKGKRNGESK